MSLPCQPFLKRATFVAKGEYTAMPSLEVSK